MQIIDIIVSPNGNAVVDVQGIKGSKCRDLTTKLEQALGSVQSTKDTMEMYERVDVDIRIENQT